MAQQALASTTSASFPGILRFPPANTAANVRVAYSRDTVRMIAQEATEATGKGDLTLEQIEAVHAAHAVIAYARRDLSPSVYSAFVNWAESASSMLTKADDADAVIDAQVNYCDTLLDELVAVRARNTQDVALQAHLLAMAERYGTSFGRITGQHQPKAHQAKDRELVQRLGFSSPLCESLDELSMTAHRLSGTPSYWSSEVGSVIYDAFKAAHADALFPPIAKPATRSERGELSIIRSMARCVIAHAEALLSPAVYRSFLRYGETGAHFRTFWQDDKEGDRRCQTHSAATRALGQTAGANVHDLSLKAYILALEIEDAAPLGPRKFECDGFNVDQVMSGLANDCTRLSPLPTMLHRLMEYAETCSDMTTNLSDAVGSTIRSAFQEAIDGDVDAAASRAFDHPDARLLHAFAALQEGAREFMEGVSLDAEEDEARDRALIEAERIVLETPGVTIAAIVAKMRVAFVHEFDDAEATWALADPNSPAFVFTLEKRRKERWDAIENLARIGGVDLSRKLPL